MAFGVIFGRLGVRRSALLVCLCFCACSRTGLEVELPLTACVSCVDAGSPEALDGASCPSGSTACDSQCVDLSSNVQHCGACDTACTDGSGCRNGVCACPSGLPGCGPRPLECGPNQVACPDPDGGAPCVTIASDPENCGGCGQVCASGLQCIDSRCTLVCPAGFSKCTAASGADYCADSGSDPENCGACGSVCALPNVKSADCVSGVCGISECTAGSVDCDSVADNGCECRAGACINGQCGKRVFLTSEIFTADLGGARGGDRECQTLADLAGLGGTYMAWLSDRESSPSTRFTRASVPYVRVDGVVVANDWTDLTDLTLAAPIDVTELGTAPPVGTACDGVGAWTNTWVNGTFWADFSSCDDWTNVNASSGFSGKIDATNWWWSLDCQGGCTGTAALYCFEQ